ncbi:MAG: NDP-sugar synthase [Pyrinomonadaceae bacterium MAG19_C2-C3]|nr:NDP-sugar synthase [Pyrinomonadaceae bacterium MAG19_C2-C3]
MQALILAGGKGTRLRPLTVYTPKPIVPICNRPFLLYQIETLKRAGITDITLSLNYQPQKIEQLLGDGSQHGVRLRYTVEPNPMGTAGAYKFAEEHIRETTVVFNGDILTDLDLDAVIGEHRERHATATIVLAPVEDVSAYGVVETDEDGRVLRFLEKPNPDETTSNTINAGTYILEPHVLDIIPDGENFSFEYGVFPALLERDEKFFAHIPQLSYWIDLGTPERYLQAHHDLLADRVGRIRFTEEERGRGTFTQHDAQIDEASIIGEGCTIKAGVSITNSVVGEGCHIEEKAQIKDSVVWSHSNIGTNAVISNAVIGRSCIIGHHAQIGAGAVLGDKTSLTDYTRTS